MTEFGGANNDKAVDESEGLGAYLNEDACRAILIQFGHDFIRRGPIRAVQMLHAGSVETPGGVVNYQSGDWIVPDDSGHPTVYHNETFINDFRPFRKRWEKKIPKPKAIKGKETGA
jgi:hypothetical protein